MNNLTFALGAHNTLLIPDCPSQHEPDTPATLQEGMKLPTTQEEVDIFKAFTNIRDEDLVQASSLNISLKSLDTRPASLPSLRPHSPGGQTFVLHHLPSPSTSSTTSELLLAILLPDPQTTTDGTDGLDDLFYDDTAQSPAAASANVASGTGPHDTPSRRGSEVGINSRLDSLEDFSAAWRPAQSYPSPSSLSETEDIASLRDDPSQSRPSAMSIGAGNNSLPSAQRSVDTMGYPPPSTASSPESPQSNVTQWLPPNPNATPGSSSHTRETTPLLDNQSRCRWSNCNTILTFYGGDERSTIKKHLQSAHNLSLRKDHTLACKWDGCRRVEPLQGHSMARHVSSHILEYECPLCPPGTKPYSSRDGLVRHQRAKHEGLPGPGTTKKRSPPGAQEDQRPSKRPRH
ncbi:hypothetical protein PLICRDRAFT_532024 [Plicaturopsis crispa FD-325 SS-3]|nr:hypothetical protein PLICRDRAFT_532024 [Plicaturopsis crispa FD-325 SS-3]